MLNISTGVMTIPINGYYFYSIEGRLDSLLVLIIILIYSTDSSGNSNGYVCRTLSCKAVVTLHTMRLLQQECCI